MAAASSSSTSRRHAPPSAVLRFVKQVMEMERNDIMRYPSGQVAGREIGDINLAGMLDHEARGQAEILPGLIYRRPARSFSPANCSINTARSASR